MGKSSKYKYLFKNIGILTISNFASKILVFLLVPLYTSILSTEEYGIYDLAITSVQLLFPILTVNIVDAVMRFSMDRYAGKEDVARIGFQYILRSFLAAFIIFLLCGRLKLVRSFYGYTTYIIGYYIFYVLNQYMIQLAKGLECITAMGIAGVIGTVLFIVGNILLLIMLPLGLPGFFIANILSQLGSALYLSVKVKVWKYIKKRNPNRALEREMLCYCAPLIFTVVGWWVNGTADRYVVSFICGMASNGLLSVAYKIPSMINTLQNIFIQAWQISAVKEYGATDSPYFYGTAFMSLNAVMGLACSLLILLSRPLARVLYAKDFYFAWKYVPFLLLSCVINCASGFLGPILSAKKDSKNMALSAVYGAVFNIICNVLLVHMMGVQGATVATFLSSYVIYVVRRRASRELIQVNRYWAIYVIWGLLTLQSTLEVLGIFTGTEIMIVLILLGVNIFAIKTFIKDGKRSG